MNLTPHQLDVLNRINGCKPTKLIARDMGISPRTLYRHQQDIAVKLNVPTSSRYAIVQEAKRRGILRERTAA